MTNHTFWYPPFTDSIVEIIDPMNRKTWKVIKGRKSVEQLLNEMIDDPRNNMTAAGKTKSRTWHQL